MFQMYLGNRHSGEDESRTQELREFTTRGVTLNTGTFVSHHAAVLGSCQLIFTLLGLHRCFRCTNIMTANHNFTKKSPIGKAVQP